MKEYTLLERVMLVLKVIMSIVSWVSRILFKIARNKLPGGDTPKAVGTTASGVGSSGSQAS